MPHNSLSESRRIHTALTLVSVFSLIVLVIFFYLPYHAHVLIPYMWIGWFLPIEGFILMFIIGSVILSLGTLYLLSRTTRIKTNLYRLTEFWRVGLRIYLGASLITVALLVWVREPFRTDFPELVNYLASRGPFQWYGAFLASAVLPNAQLAATLIQYIQLFIGICLLIGFLTNLVSIAGIILHVNFLMAIGWVDPTWTVATQNIFMVVTLALFILLHVGRSFGIDEFLAKKFPNILW